MSADGDIVRSRLSFPSEPEVAAALARLEAAEARAEELETRLRSINTEVVQDGIARVEAQRDALAEALRQIAYHPDGPDAYEVGEARWRIARAGLAEAGMIADSDTTTVWKT